MTLILERVHGIPFNKLSTLVNQEWTKRDGSLVLFPENIGGWSNINILGQASIGKVVLKLPSYTKTSHTNPYLAEFKVCEFLSRQELCPIPLATGFLNDKTHIPYALYKFVEGIVYESPTDISSTHLESLREALDHLAKTKPPNIRDYYEPSSMIGYISKNLEFPSASLKKISQYLRKILNELKVTSYKLMDILDSMCEWSKHTIHGDLQESNIVFQGEKAIFIDLRSCSIANPLYDIAYFLIQAPGPPISCPTEFMLDEEDLRTIEDLTPIALFFVTTWTLNRLINQELGFIEENLVSDHTTQAMLSYLTTKLSELHNRMNHWK